MKKIYSIIVLLFALALPMYGQEIKARLVIDDVARVKVEVNYKDYPGIVNGLNIIPVEPGTTVGIVAREGCVLKSVVCSDESGYTSEEFIQENVRCEIRFYSDYNETYTVVSASTADARSGKCTLTVDDASKIKVERSGSHSLVELADGSNTVAFDPATESELTITPLDKPIYKICVDGEDITASSDYNYVVKVSEGTEINVEANYPDKKYNLTFNLNGYGAEDFIRGVDIDGKPVFDYMEPDFMVQAGAEVKIYGRTDEYEVDSFTVNGKTATFFNPFAFIMTTDAEIDITVHRFDSFVMTLCVDNPARVRAYRGYSYNGDELELVAGENEVEIRRDIPIISFVPAEMCYIATAEVDGYVYEADELKVSPFKIGRLTDGSRIDITTGDIVRDKRALVYINDLSVAEGYFSLLRSDRTAIDGLTEGYNTIEFYDGDNAFTLQTGAPVVESYVYLNDEVCDAIFPDSNDYSVSLADGDVVKVFYGEIPYTRLVNVEIEDGLEVTLTADHIRPVDVAAGSFRALDRTHVTVSAPEGSVLTLDGTVMQADADGVHSFTVTGDHSLKVSRPMGIGDVETDCDAPAVWYNLQGIRVENPTAPGLYIVNGKKVRK